MEIFKYGDPEIEYLKKKDKKLGEAIGRIGKIEREIIPDLYTALISSIVGQQISSRAADTVWARLRGISEEITPKSLAAIPMEEIQKCGMSMRKAAYIKGITDAVIDGRLDMEELKTLPDEEVVKRLTAFHGIGVWTAEMLMIFSMERPDVLSWNDLAIRRGMSRLYHHKDLTKEQFLRYKKRYSPCGSLASLYLWEISKDE